VATTSDIRPIIDKANQEEQVKFNQVIVETAASDPDYKMFKLTWYRAPRKTDKEN
jgi:hypothetical protein